MKSFRQIEREYIKMIDQAENNNHFGEINVFMCPSGHAIKTIDIDPGKTPGFVNCGECGQKALSSEYKDILPELPVTYEFYRPDIRWIIRNRKKPEVDYILKGGLLLRKRG